MYRLFVSCIKPLSFYQKIGIAHRDVKPNNIMKSLRDMMYKLVDFGEMKIKSSNIFNSVVSLAGTPTFLSPEVIIYENNFVIKNLYNDKNR